MNVKQKQYEYIPYPLRYKEQKEDNKKLLLTGLLLSGSYVLFLALIGMRLGW